jgi:hypothetical protein
MKFECSRHIFEKVSSIKFHQNPYSGSRIYDKDIVTLDGTKREILLEVLVIVVRF